MQEALQPKPFEETEGEEVENSENDPEENNTQKKDNKNEEKRIINKDGREFVVIKGGKKEGEKRLKHKFTERPKITPNSNDIEPEIDKPINGQRRY